MERFYLSITLSVLVLFSSFSLLAQSNASPDLFTRTGSKLTFVATTPDKGTELWSSGGSTATTAILKDINAGENSSIPMFFEWYAVRNVANAKTFFMATDGVNGLSLWVTNGTLSGTRIAKDFTPDGSDAYFFIPAADSAYAYVELLSPDGGNSLLYKASAATGTTTLMGEIPGQMSVGALANNEKFYYIANLAPAGMGSFYLCIYNTKQGYVGNRCDHYFGDSFTDLHKTADGFFIRTYNYDQIDPYGNNVKEDIYYFKYAANTPVFIGSYDASTFFPLAKAGNNAYFIAENKLYKTNGTEAGTAPVMTFSGNVSSAVFAVMYNSLYFVAENMLYKITDSYVNTLGEFSGVYEMISTNQTGPGTIYFTAQGQDELWKTIGAAPVRILSDTTGGGIKDLIYHNSYLYFTDVSDSGSDRFWRSTAALASIIKVW
ncbi:MAG TPA: hypothetical protein PLV42_10470 [bacterium]|nr:hypothetical protein [bacterium]